MRLGRECAQGRDRLPYEAGLKLLAVPRAPKELQCEIFLRDGAWLLHVRSAFRGKSRGASKLWQIILRPLHLQPMHLFDSLGDCFHRFTFGVAQRHASLFLARERIFNRQLRVVAITPAPKSAHRLLASVHHLCESGGMRLSIREFAFRFASVGDAVAESVLNSGPESGHLTVDDSRDCLIVR